MSGDILDVARRLHTVSRELTEHRLGTRCLAPRQLARRAVDALTYGRSLAELARGLRCVHAVDALSAGVAIEAIAIAVGVESHTLGENEVIPVGLADTTKLVPRSSVRWVTAHGDYARLHTSEGSHLVRVPLSRLEDRWSEAGFVRIHRSFLVALPLVTELRMSSSGYVVRVGDGDDAAELPVSRRRTRDLKDRLVRAAKLGVSMRSAGVGA